LTAFEIAGNQKEAGGEEEEGGRVRRGWRGRGRKEGSAEVLKEG